MIRNGSVRIQTIGYSTSANNANGQHKKRRTIQSINVSILTSLCYSFILYGNAADYVSNNSPMILL